MARFSERCINANVEWCVVIGQFVCRIVSHEVLRVKAVRSSSFWKCWSKILQIYRKLQDTSVGYGSVPIATDAFVANFHHFALFLQISSDRQARNQNWELVFTHYQVSAFRLVRLHTKPRGSFLVQKHQQFVEWCAKKKFNVFERLQTKKV